MPSGPPKHPNLVTPSIEQERERIENDFFAFFHTTVDKAIEEALENLSEEDGLRLATIRAEKAAEATAETAAAAQRVNAWNVVCTHERGPERLYLLQAGFSWKTYGVRRNESISNR